MPHSVMPPFNSDKAQAHSEFASEFNMHKNEEQIESKNMEVNSAITPKSQPTKLEMTCSTRNVFSAAYVFGKEEGSILFQASAPYKS